MLFVIPRTSLYRGSLNRGSTVILFERILLLQPDHQSSVFRAFISEAEAF